MDTKESGKGSQKHLTVETGRPPVRQPERSNGVATHRGRIREVSSRYMSTSIHNLPATKRCSSPVPRSTAMPASVVVPKRAVSAERKRPSTPTSPSHTSTPVRDIDMSLADRKIALTKQPERVWPSTMRSLNVSFQTDVIHTAKKEKPVTHALSSPSSRLSSNAFHKQHESQRTFKKETPQRSRSPLKGKNLFDQTENAKPGDSSHARSVDQHRWPSITGGRVSSSSLNQSLDSTDKIRNSSGTIPRIGIPSLRKVSDGMAKPIYRSSSDTDTSNSIPLDPNISEIQKIGIPSLRRVSDGMIKPIYRTSNDTSNSKPSDPTNLEISKLGIPLLRRVSDGMAKPLYRTSSDSSDSIPSDPNISEIPRIGIPSLRRISDGMAKPMYRTCSDASTSIPSDTNMPEIPRIGVPLLRRVSDGMAKPIFRTSSDASNIISSDQNTRIRIPSLRRVSDATNNPMYRTSGDASNIIPSDTNVPERKGLEGDLLSDNGLPKLPELRKLTIPAVRSQSLPGSRQPSPVQTSTQTKVYTPSHSRPATPTRGHSPSRIRPLSSSSQSISSASVLSFITDFRNPKKSNQLEDAHQLRLLYNRHLQWRFANARTDISMRIQKVTAERSLNNVWRTNLALWDSVTKKRICLQQMKIELKLNSILTEQLRYLDDWASFEKDYCLSLTGVTKDLEDSTLRLPLTAGAQVDIKYLKIAISSAMDVMQSMGPSVITLLPKAEVMNPLVSRLADLVARERAMLEECKDLLAMNTAMQVEEKSLRTHLIQTYASIDRY